MTSKPERIICEVPFCGRSKLKSRDEEWICNKHWSSIPLSCRKVYRRAYRRWEAARAKGTPIPNGWVSFSSKADSLEESRSRASCYRLWSRMKAIAIRLAY